MGVIDDNTAVLIYSFLRPLNDVVPRSFETKHKDSYISLNPRGTTATLDMKAVHKMQKARPAPTRRRYDTEGNRIEPDRSSKNDELCDHVGSLRVGKWTCPLTGSLRARFRIESVSKMRP